MSNPVQQGGTGERPAGKRRGGAPVALAVLLVALLLRAPIASVPPGLAAISLDLGLTPTAAGLATGLPLICFGVFAFLTPSLSGRFGPEVTLWVAIVLIGLGLGLRSVPVVGWFFAGITLVGLGIAIGNVIIPAIIRAGFPARIALMMGLYSLGLQLGAALGAASTAPLLGRGASWSTAIGIWLVPCVVVGVLWTAIAIRTAGRRSTRAVVHSNALGSVARRPLTWAICSYMGLQSATFYTLLTWIPQILLDAGFSIGQAGMLLTAFSLLGVPGSFLGPRLAAASWGGTAGWGVAALIGVSVAGAAAMILLMFPGGSMIVAVVIAGLVQGVQLAVGLTFIAHQKAPADVPAVSALAQGGGYAFAALGPTVLGALYSATGAWTLPLVVLIGIFAAAAAAALWVLYASRAWSGSLEQIN